jgi:hypothetical protein
VHAHADVIGAEVVLWRPLEDLSLGGCKFAGPAWEEAGAQVSAGAELPGDRRERAAAGGGGPRGARDMALRFHGISEEQRQTLRKHMQDSHDAAAAG